MLTSLQIQNFALIEDVCIDFTPGFNVFTGETGAGKSILIDAFGVALGGRASLDYLRSGTDYYWVQAVFDLEKEPQVLTLVEELDIPVEENTLFLRRKVLANGKSQAFVNDRQVPVSALSKLAAALVDMHGQHENQTLLKPETPLNLIDIYGGTNLKAALTSYQKTYAEYQEVTKKLQNVRLLHASQDERKEELVRAIDEITALQPQNNEDELLRAKIQKLTNRGKVLEGVTLAHNLLHGDEEQEGALDALTLAKQNLRKAAQYDSSLGEVAEALESAWLTLDDARQSLGSYLAEDEFDAESLNKYQERLDKLFKLKQKYGGSLKAVLSYWSKAKEEYANLADGEGLLKKLEEEEKQLFSTLQRAGKELTLLRQKSGDDFAAKITSHIKDLAMEEGRVVLSITPTENFTNLGRDKVEFLFTANLGIEPKSLNKIASGGELSRLALAIKTVLLEKYGVATMVFDEIDTGVGGVTAQKMAEKIAIIANYRQVICVTHLAQIASFADNHLHIKKVVKEQQTFTLVEPLGAKERVSEIMRMAGGTNVTAAASKNAQELLALAEKVKQRIKSEA